MLDALALGLLLAAVPATWTFEVYLAAIDGKVDPVLDPPLARGLLP